MLDIKVRNIKPRFEKNEIDGTLEFDADFRCLACGGLRISYPDEDGDDALVVCSKCKQEIGFLWMVKYYAAWLAHYEHRYMRKASP